MIYVLKNNYLQVKINSLGAEVVEILDKDNINRMHTPNKETWDRVSPVLFPQISKTRDFLYRVNGKDYYMPRHGFVRNSEIDVITKTDESIVFLIKDNEETLKVYPYHFEFYIKYELNKNSLKASFNVVNKGDSNLLFMLGGHPGFKVPLFDNESYEDYYVEFEKNETVEAMQVIDGYLANVYKPCLNNENKIYLRHEMFDPDAIIMKNLKSTYVEIKTDKNDKKIKFYFSDFEILAIWSKTLLNANFVCLEPWNGIQKDFVVDHEKMGVLSINPHSHKEYSYTIEVIN